MIKLKFIVLPALFILIILSGCKDDLEVNIYERPDWLAGKVYTQILEQPELSTFARCIELTGYDTIINVSGSYTAFGPTNEAFDEWLAQKPYNSVDDVPLPELTRLVKYHLVQNPWSKNQLRSLDVYGWIDTLDVNNDEPRGFKRETLLREDNRKYGVAVANRSGDYENVIIVDTTSTDRYRRVITNSRKYVPFFYQEYFNIYDLSTSDYEFYFDRPFTGGNDIYFAGARIVGEEVFAENGFVYAIDKVVEPLDNSYQILEKEYPSYSYSQFLELVNRFPDFNYNQQETFNQPGADQGLAVDSLFDLNFPQLMFNVTSERTQPPRGTVGLPQNVTIRYHHGLMAPTNQALENFISEYIEVAGGWGSFSGTPDFIKKIIANSYFSINSIYPTDFKEGFYNGENDIVTLDESDIIQKEFTSNSTFIGLNQAIVPRAFSSVAGPVYLRQGYRKVMYAIEQAGLLPALKRQNRDYMLFVESDRNTSTDSSFIYNSSEEKFFVYLISPESAEYTEYELTSGDLRTLLLNHVASGLPKGIARKEFIPNLAGNYIIVNNETGEYSGTGTTTVGFRGGESAPNFPSEISTNADNGKTFDINNWFSFNAPTIYSKISGSYPEFHKLLRKAGFALEKEFRYSFISNSASYTVFVPSEEALDSAGVSSMPVAELRQFLLLHFVQGNVIFTDGSSNPGYYSTVRKDEKSTPFSTVFTPLNIEPDIDVIRIKDKNGGNYIEIPESALTNQLAGINTGEGEEVFNSMITNTVIHEIDKVLVKEELDTN